MAASLPRAVERQHRAYDRPLAGRGLDGQRAVARPHAVAEALTNVAKYAQASHAVVRIAREGSDLVVEVLDDGVGGAEVGKGSGLSGLADRVGASDGSLSVESPPGEGTVVRAVLPLNGAG